MSTTLPVLDLHDLDRDALRDVTHELGFLHLRHDIEPRVTDELFAVARRFFALPEQDKEAISMLRSPWFRGYTRTGGELTQGRVDWREQIDVGPEREPSPVREPGWLRLDGPNQWPDALPDLRRVLTAWTERLGIIAQRLLEAWSESLGAPPDHFAAAFARPSTLLKVVRYPGRADGEPRQGVGAHKDPGVLTLLLPEPGSTGLQVRVDGAGVDGWIDVDPVPGAFVVNIGELLEVATDGYLRATEHRVVSPPAGTDRLSVPYFHNPALDARVPPVQLPAALAARARGVSTDAANVLTDTYGRNLLKARLRAHPDVAARHHADLLG